MTYRPKSFDDLVGQNLNVELLRCILKAPQDSPRVLLFEGAFGTGKTTAARIFARGLNCDKGPSDPCGKCSVCTQEDAHFFQELDSSDVGTKEQIQELKESLFATASFHPWSVIVFDEFHLASRPAQSALLKSLEGLPREMFVIFCTTDVAKILPTIRSRAVTMTFEKIPVEDLKVNLLRVAAAEGILLEEALATRIALHSKGHARDSVMLLDVYKSLKDPRAFLKHIPSGERALIRLLCAIKQGDKAETQEALGPVLRFPLDTLRSDLHRVLQEGLKLFSTEETPASYSQEYKVLVDLYRGDLLKLFGFSMSEWAINSFTDDLALQAFFWAAFLTFGEKKQAVAGAPGAAPQKMADRFRKKGAPSGPA